MKYPEPFNKLVEDLRALPGIGEKTARRLALFIVTEMDKEKILNLSSSLATIKAIIKNCPVCGAMMEESCPICSDPTRHQDAIMVVESVKDLFVMENSGSYHGLYHVLGGTIDFSRGVDPSSLRFNQLLIRLDNIKEVIIALNASVDGDLTGTYIKALLKEKDILISRIAYGIPVGSDLSYADQKTLSLALENRTKIK